MNVVRLAWAPTSHGFTDVSELTTSTRSSGTPSVSATIIASTVSDPCPISVAPVISETRPKSSQLDDGAAAVRAVDARAAADVEHAGVADAALPAGRRGGGTSRRISSVTASRHSPIAHEVMTKPWGLASPGRVTLRRRSSRRSRPSRSASSSIWLSTANVDSRLP